MNIKQEDVVSRFLRYVQIDTQSNERSGTHPSTAKQHDLAKLLYKELKALPLSNVYYDEKHCYVYAHLPASKGHETAMKLAFLAHMDTSDAASGSHVRPRIVKRYDGKDILLNKSGDARLSPKMFPELRSHKGEDLIVTDGTTLLGADDKAGVAEIMTLIQELCLHPELAHGPVRVCFTPDEEIGEGTDFIDLKRLDADAGYTVDGGKCGELEYECFHAAEAELIFQGLSVHPGYAKNRMINAALLAYEFQSMLPPNETPEHTEGREGFYHLTLMKGSCEKAVAYYIIRDHDKRTFKARKRTMEQIASFLNDRYGKGSVELKIEDSYANMIDGMKPHMHLIKNARAAMQAVGVQPIEHPIRGGTDGAKLTFMGLPCPNLGTGGYNFHGRLEYASVPEMEQTVRILTEIVKRYA